MVGLRPEELLSELQALQLAAMYDCEDTAAAGGEGSDAAAAAAAGGLRGGLGLKGKKLLGQQAEEFLVQQVRDGSGASITPLNPDIQSGGGWGEARPIKPVVSPVERQLRVVVCREEMGRQSSLVQQMCAAEGTIGGGGACGEAGGQGVIGFDALFFFFLFFLFGLFYFIFLSSSLFVYYHFFHLCSRQRRGVVTALLGQRKRGK